MTGISYIAIAKAAGTTNFRIVDYDTKIITFSTSKQMSKNLDRQLAAQKGSHPGFSYAKIKKPFDKANCIASMDALSIQEKRELTRQRKARIIKKASL